MESHTFPASMHLSQRDLMRAGLGAQGAIGSLGELGPSAIAQTGTPARASFPPPMTPEEHVAILCPGGERIAIALYPQFTALDGIGPHHAFINMVGTLIAMREAIGPQSKEAIRAVLATQGHN